MRTTSIVLLAGLMLLAGGFLTDTLAERGAVDEAARRAPAEISEFVPSLSPKGTAFFEGFEGGVVPPSGWTATVNNPYTWEIDDSPHSGDHNASCFYDPALGGQDEWITTPGINLTGLSSPTLDFWWMASDYWMCQAGNYNGYVYVDDNGNWADYDTIWDCYADECPYTNWTYYNTVIDLSAYSGTIELAFVYYGNDGAQLSIDDIAVMFSADYDVATISIDNPTGVVVPGTPYTPQATVENLGAYSETFDVYCTIGVYNDVQTVTSLGSGLTQQVSFASWSPPSMKANYTMTVYTDLSTDEDNSNDTLSTTLVSCSPMTLPYSETFDAGWGPYGDNPPACWTIIDNGIPGDAWNGNDWAYASSKASDYSDAISLKSKLMREHHENPSLELYDSMDDILSPWTPLSKQSDVAKVNWSPVEQQDDWLISPTLDCSGETAVLLKFWHNFNWYSVDETDTGFVYISTDDGMSWPHTVAMYEGADISGNEEINISSIVAGESQVKIAFRYVAHDDMYWKIDDVVVEAIPANDVGAVAVSWPVYLIFTNYYEVGQPMSIDVEVFNFGSVTETFDVTCSVDGTDLVETVTALPPGVQQTVNFAFTPTAEVTYSVTAYTQLAGDMVPSNDTTSAPDLFAGQIPKAYPYCADFETSKGAEGWEVGSWYPTFDFEVGTPTSGPGFAYSGANAWATILDADYNANRQEVLISPLIDLTTASPSDIYFMFQHAVKVETGWYYGYDGGNVSITFPDATSFWFMNPVGGYPAPGIFVVGGWGYPGWGDESLDWPNYNEVSMSQSGLEYNPYFGASIQLYGLSSACGQIVRFIFFFSSDYSFTEPGWYLDYINIGEPIAPVISFPDGDDFDITETEYITFGVSADDINCYETLTITMFDFPAGATFTMAKDNEVNGHFEWTPDYCQAGEHDIGFYAEDNAGLRDTGYVHISVEDVNQAPYWTDVPDAALSVEEMRTVCTDMEAADDDVCDGDLLTLWFDGDPYGYWDSNTSDANPVNGNFCFTPDCDGFENGPAYTYTFYVTDNHDDGDAPDTITAETVVTVLNNDPPEFTEVTGDYYVVKCDTYVVHIETFDPDDWPFDEEGAPGELVITWAPDPDMPDPDCGADPPVPTADYEAWIVDHEDGTADFYFHACPHFVPPRIHDMTFTFEFTVTDKCGETAVAYHTFEIDECKFMFHVKKVFAYPGEQHVKVPVFLYNPWDEIGGWDVVLEFDNSVGEVVGVELCDEIYVDDEAHVGWHYAPWYYDPGLKPEYFTYNLGVYGHDDYLRVIGIQNLPWPQPIVPDLPRDEQALIFCVIFDVSPLWDGHVMTMTFHTKECPDNTLTDSDGYLLWGPTLDDAPEWTCPERDESMRVVCLMGGHAIGLQTVTVGDLNCNSIAYEIGDAVVFINYLVFGSDALCDQACIDMYGDPECYAAQGEASDINADGYAWTVADLVMLLNTINGYDYPMKTSSIEPVEVDVSGIENGWTVSTTSNSTIGAGLFTFRYADGFTIGTDAAERLDGMEMATYAKNGELKVLVYSMESHSIAAGTGELFTISATRRLRDDDAKGALMLVDASFSDDYGRLLPVGDVAKFGVQTGGDVDMPRTFTLEQSYPNPFANRATIAFGIPRNANVTLNVYNLAGQLVETLVDKNMNAGYHRIDWDASDVPSGLYFYKLEADNYSATRRATIVR